MLKLFFFSGNAPDNDSSQCQLVVAETVQEAEDILLQPNGGDSLLSSMERLMVNGGERYESAGSVKDALRLFLPYVSVLSVEPGQILCARNSYSRLVANPVYSAFRQIPQKKA